MRKTAALAFVPRRYVQLAWQAVKAKAPQLPRIQEFMAYYEMTWLVGSYPLPLWNVFESGSTRTNNHAEGWHNRLKKVVRKAHPNEFEIVETFKREQASTEVSIAQLATERDKKIEELKTRFTANSLTLDKYLSGVSAHTNL